VEDPNPQNRGITILESLEIGGDFVPILLAKRASLQNAPAAETNKY
jgi:hypothetical protein